jgi:hypothetical protein
LPRLTRPAPEGVRRVLDFDIETRRIGFHSAGKFSPDGCEPVAIAAGWADEEQVYVWTLKECPSRAMLTAFRHLWDMAGLVTGHYCIPFDIPILNGALFEHGLPLLSPKLVTDTHRHFVKVAGFSKSQENLSAMLATGSKKFHMNDHAWRQVARLKPDAMEAARKRAHDDVIQHKEDRLALLAAGALSEPKVWKPSRG